jgi:EAL domain-containing protein (putative c-di-GMP-specific phosphodiesterase class I)
MGGDSESRQVVRTIVLLAHTLKMDVVAEGVETTEQLAQLKSMACEHGQGYVFCEPVGPEAVAELIRTGTGLVPITL